VLLSASANVFSWYWINNANGDGWAGSWFFHSFWNFLSQDQTVNEAYTNAIAFMPFDQFSPLQVIQNPLIYDSPSIATQWGFAETTKL